MSGFSSCGAELDLFAGATGWKRYYGAQLRTYLSGDVLEVGAGIGGSTRWLCDGRQHSWTCLEPDAALATELRRSIVDMPCPVPIEVEIGFVSDLAAEPVYDTILYIDVLEHIDDDRGELRDAERRLRPGGHMIVLAPAHGWLFSQFDLQIGHRRRYTRRTLAALAPEHTQVVEAFFLDSLGIVVSLANRLRRRALPTRREIALWHRFLVPLSRWIDWCLGRRIGKTVVVVFRKAHQP